MIPDGLAALAKQHLRDCRLCPRDCAVDRTATATGAFCRLGSEAFVYKELLSLGEESVVSPTWLVDLGGCSWRCLFCTEWAHVVAPTRPPGVALQSAWFLPRLRQRRAQGARTLSLVGGEPTVSLPALVATLAEVPAGDWLPVVWKSNGLFTDAALALLDGWVATFSIDVKFGNPACAQRLAGAPWDPWPHLPQLRRLARPVAGLPPLQVRHLLMPGHLDCCTRPVLERLAAELPEVPVNLMTTYLPAGPAAQGHAHVHELTTMATAGERLAAVALARASVPRLWIDGKPLTS